MIQNFIEKFPKYEDKDGCWQYATQEEFCWFQDGHDFRQKYGAVVKLPVGKSGIRTLEENIYHNQLKKLIDTNLIPCYLSFWFSATNKYFT